MCEKCLYRKNCQFLAKQKPCKVEGCTAFKSEKELRADTVSEIRARVAVHFGTYCEKDQVKIADVFRLIDQIAREMEGE